ncbi:hypothetical protein QBC40DRAFT_320907, partial [Triangularia verruculosa]
AIRYHSTIFKVYFSRTTTFTTIIATITNVVNTEAMPRKRSPSPRLSYFSLSPSTTEVHHELLDLPKKIEFILPAPSLGEKLKPEHLDGIHRLLVRVPTRLIVLIDREILREMLYSSPNNGWILEEVEVALGGLVGVLYRGVNGDTKGGFEVVRDSLRVERNRKGLAVAVRFVIGRGSVVGAGDGGGGRDREGWGELLPEGLEIGEGEEGRVPGVLGVDFMDIRMGSVVLARVRNVYHLGE